MHREDPARPRAGAPGGRAGSRASVSARRRSLPLRLPLRPLPRRTRPIRWSPRLAASRRPSRRTCSAPGQHHQPELTPGTLSIYNRLPCLRRPEAVPIERGSSVGEGSRRPPGTPHEGKPAHPEIPRSSVLLLTQAGLSALPSKSKWIPKYHQGRSAQTYLRLLSCHLVSC